MGTGQEVREAGAGGVGAGNLCAAICPCPTLLPGGRAPAPPSSMTSPAPVCSPSLDSPGPNAPRSPAPGKEESRGEMLTAAGSPGAWPAQRSPWNQRALDSNTAAAPADSGRVGARHVTFLRLSFSTYKMATVSLSFLGPVRS